jgi:hypothetical protein
MDPEFEKFVKGTGLTDTQIKRLTVAEKIALRSAFSQSVAGMFLSS